jgi:hypothetical protein
MAGGATGYCAMGNCVTATLPSTMMNNATTRQNQFDENLAMKFAP